MDGSCVCLDSIQNAAQLGRLDFLSALLASISVALVLGGVFAFLNFRSIAKETAKDEAAEISKQVAARVTNEYLKEELLNVLKEYEVFRDTSDISEDDADGIAGAQENGGTK